MKRDKFEEIYKTLEVYSDNLDRYSFSKPLRDSFLRIYNPEDKLEQNLKVAVCATFGYPVSPEIVYLNPDYTKFQESYVFSTGLRNDYEYFITLEDYNNDIIIAEIYAKLTPLN